MIKTAILFLAASIALFSPGQEAAGPTAEATYRVDPVHSSVIFRVQHARAAFFYGRFNEVAGTVELDPDNPESAKIKIRVKADSVDTRIERRDRDVRGPDFLDAKQFPEITYQSSKVSMREEEGVYDVEGELSLHGVKKPLKIEVHFTGKGKFMRQTRMGYETSFTVKRSDFGIRYGLRNKVVGDEVRMTFALEMIVR